MKLSLKTQRFIEEYLVDFNGTKAAIRAGFKKSNARRYASELLTKPDIRKLVDERKKELANACGITLEEVVGNAREVIVRCRMTGRRYRPREILIANQQLTDLGGFVVRHTELTGKNAGPLELIVRNVGNFTKPS